MQVTFPSYYKQFSCIAGACPDTCCAGWQIMIDDKSMKKYRRFRGTFRNRLLNDVDWEVHAFRQYDYRCAFLNEAARIILSQEAPVQFRRFERATKEETYEDFDYFLFSALMDTRDYLLTVLQNRSVPVRFRLLKLLVCGHDFQLAIDRK